MTWTWISLGFAILAYVLHAVLRRKRKTKHHTSLPPGPRGIPILGNLHMLGEFPHRDLHRLAKEYGPIMYLRLGFVPTIVVSSPKAAELFLKTHDLIFASRPFVQAAKYISYNRTGLSFSEYSSYWRNIRKLCTLELLSNLKINSFKSMRREELDLLIQSLKDVAKDRVAADISAKVFSLTSDLSCQMVLGKKYSDDDLDERGFKAMMQEGMHLAAVPNMADYIPLIGIFDLQGLGRRMKFVGKVFDEFFEKIINEHVQTKDKKGHTKDFVDSMLSIIESKDTEFSITRPNMKAIMLDMLAGSMDTSATAIEWTLSEIFRHPRVMKKVHEELDRVVGMERMVEESDLDNLEYLDMVVKESFRLHPVAPLLIPHESMQDCTVNGFHIPRKARIIVNTWAISRDPEAWIDAENFVPERFMGNNIDVRGRDFRLLPFGSGRRGCPGIQLGLTVVRMVVAQLVHCFDWELPNEMLPTELDMKEEFGLTLPRANHLVAIPTYRLCK